MTTEARLIELLAHAVAVADGWYDDSRGGIDGTNGRIEGDPLIDEARMIVASRAIPVNVGGETIGMTAHEIWKLGRISGN